MLPGVKDLLGLKEQNRKNETSISVLSVSSIHVKAFPHCEWKYKIKLPEASRFSADYITQCDVTTTAKPLEEPTTGNRCISRGGRATQNICHLFFLIIW